MSSLTPKTALPMPWVKTWVPAPRASAGACCPDPVTFDVGVADRCEAEDDAGCHARTDRKPEEIGELSGAGLSGVELRHRQSGEPNGESQDHEGASGPPVPGWPAAPEPAGELEGAQDRVGDRADDVHHHGRG